MNIPVDTVVELLMENLPNKWMWTLHGRTIEAEAGEDLSDAIRTYLETLVPKPVKLSECEECKGSGAVEFVGDFMQRCDRCSATGMVDAKDVEVIQPAEVK